MNSSLASALSNTPLNMMLSLGQDSDHGKIDSLSQTFLGTITQFFFYNRKLEDEEIMNLYRNNVSAVVNPVIAWSDFRGKANNTDVYEIDYPF